MPSLFLSLLSPFFLARQCLYFGHLCSAGPWGNIFPFLYAQAFLQNTVVRWAEIDIMGTSIPKERMDVVHPHLFQAPLRPSRGVRPGFQAWVELFPWVCLFTFFPFRTELRDRLSHFVTVLLLTLHGDTSILSETDSFRTSVFDIQIWVFWYEICFFFPKEFKFCLSRLLFAPQNYKISTLI